MRILSFIGSLGFQWGYVGQTATQSLPLVSHDICTGLTRSLNCFSLAKRLTWTFLSAFIFSMASLPGARKACLPSFSVPGKFVLVGMKSGVLLSSGACDSPLAAAQTTLSRLAVMT